MLWEVGSMMILIAILIAVVAISLMMTVLVASTRTFGAYDQSVSGARTAASHPNGPSWLDLDRAPPPSRAIDARPTQHEIVALPVPAPVTPKALEMTGTRATAHPVGEAQPRATRPRPSRRASDRGGARPGAGHRASANTSARIARLAVAAKGGE